MDSREKSARIAKLRKKIAKGIATNLEKAEVDKWDSVPRRGRKPGQKYPRKPDAAPAAGFAEAKPPEIQTTLPGSDGNASPPLPPINIDNPTAPPPGAPAPGATTGQSPPPSATKSPGMTPEEAEASGKMVADLATGMLSDLNKYAVSNGQLGIGENILMLFHFSVKRLAIKHGKAIDEDTFDYSVTCGASGFVGFNAFKAWRSQKPKEGAPDDAHKPQAPQAKKQEQPATYVNEKMGAPQVNVDPTRGNQAGAIVPFDGNSSRPLGGGFNSKGIF